MKSSPDRRVIRGAKVSGVVFCSPTGDLGAEDLNDKSQQDNLQALEVFWKNKGFQEGRSKGFEEGKKHGEEQGFPRGVLQGKQEGIAEGKKLAKTEGLEEGYKKAQTELYAVLELLMTLTKEYTEERKHFLEDVKPELLQLCQGICEKILRGELRHPLKLRELVDKTLHHISSIIDGESTSIIVSSKDMDHLKDCLQKFSATHRDIQKLQIASDPHLQQGDFRIESAKGLLNFDLERILNDLSVHILENSSSP